MISKPSPIGSDAVPVRNRSGRMQLLLAGKILTSVLLLAWILSHASLPAIFAAVASASLPLLLVAYGFDFVGCLISVTRWRLLLEAHGLQVARGFLLKSYLVAFFFNNLLPSTVGGDASRAYDCYRATGRQGRAMSSVVVDRLLGLLVLVLFALVTLPFVTPLAQYFPSLEAWLGVGVAGLAALVWGIFSGRTWPAWERLLSRLPGRLEHGLGLVVGAFRAYRGQWPVLVRAFALSVLLQSCVVMKYILISWALNLEVPAFNFFLIVPLATFVMMLPISINGIGLRENVLAVILAAYHVGVAQAVALAWLIYLGLLIFGLIGGCIYALRTRDS